MCVCVCAQFGWDKAPPPPNPDSPTSSSTPNVMQGCDAPSPGSVLFLCSVFLLFVCLTVVAARVKDWACVSQVSRYIRTPSPYFLPPLHPQLTANWSSQHQDPTPPTRPRPASWLCGILATANGGPIESLRRAACWLDSAIISNEDDSNDFSPSFPSPPIPPEYWYF